MSIAITHSFTVSSIATMLHKIEEIKNISRYEPDREDGKQKVAMFILPPELTPSMRHELNHFMKYGYKAPIPRQMHTFYGSLKMRLNIHLIKNYLDSKFADNLFVGLQRIKYNSDEESMVKIMGKQMKIPRKQVAYGEPHVNYHFAGTSVPARDWNITDSTLESHVARSLRMIAKKAGVTACSTFNYALVNNYLDETNSIGYHSDDERELGKYPVIAGISFGQEREIYFKSNITGEVVKILLPHNSIVIMHYPTNKYWKHSIPKTAKRLGQRISLTFRSVAN